MGLLDIKPTITYTPDKENPDVFLKEITTIRKSTIDVKALETKRARLEAIKLLDAETIGMIVAYYSNPDLTKTPTQKIDEKLAEVNKEIEEINKIK
jgi:hypothetical protein